MLTQLARRERMEVASASSSSEEFDPAAAQLTRTRASQDKAKPAALYQAVDLIEKSRHPLQLVNDDFPTGPMEHEETEPLGVRQQ